MQTLTLGILETGKLPEQLQTLYGNYPAMFAQLLGRSDNNLIFEHFDILNGDLPTSVSACDAWLVTGSKHGVYEDHCWIEPLSDFIRQAYHADVPSIGICFGHQLIVQALGGSVEKSTQGWGLGASSYQLSSSFANTRGINNVTEFTIQAFHQDQVTKIPPQSTVIASSEFCPYAALNIADKALTFQGHPEFSGAFSRALLSSRRDLGIIPLEQSNAAIAHSDTDLNQYFVADWICAFIRAKYQD